MPDIDIDLADRTTILNIIPHIPAAIKDKSGSVKKHNTGVYCHDIPVDPFYDFSSIEYKEAEERGYFKLDFLNVSLYKDIKNEDHLNALMNKEPLWDLLLHDEFVDLLFHLNGHGKVLKTLKPTSIVQLAAVLAMIRPAKRHLIGLDWDSIMKEIWTRPSNNDYYFKKSHAIAYATAIVVQMNLFCESFDTSN